MSKAIKASDLQAAIGTALEMYSEELTEEIDRIGQKAMKKLVDQTRQTAPSGRRSQGKNYRSAIASRTDKNKRGNRYTWYVKPPSHRLTHLIVHGHVTKNGGRTKSNPFLQNAVDAILPAYTQDVEEACKKHGQ